jgi:short-subunit dehydrogenase
VRSNDKLKETLSRFKSDLGSNSSNIQLEILDLSKWQSVKELTNRLSSQRRLFNIVIFNAGLFNPHFEVNNEGYEMMVTFPPYLHINFLIISYNYL